MSLQLRRRIFAGRTCWTAITAFYFVRIDGDGSTWYATIRHRDNDKIAHFLDRDKTGHAFTSRDAAAAAAETWIRDRVAA